MPLSSSEGGHGRCLSNGAMALSWFCVRVLCRRGPGRWGPLCRVMGRVLTSSAVARGHCEALVYHKHGDPLRVIRNWFCICCREFADSLYGILSITLVLFVMGKESLVRVSSWRRWQEAFPYFQ
eukprot:g39839.t1